MLQTALTASPTDHKVTALKSTQNPLQGMRKLSRGVWVQTATIYNSMETEKFPQKATQQISQYNTATET